MTLDDLIKQYENHYNTLNNKLDALRPLLVIYSGKDLYLLRRRLQFYHSMACDTKITISQLKSFIDNKEEDNMPEIKLPFKSIEEAEKAKEFADEMLKKVNPKREGAIVVGYPGIGKSTLANKDDRFIDLESSNFFINGERPKGWETIYCKVARDLCEQGYIVFVSSHAAVRKELQANRAWRQYIIFPDLSLKDTWTEKLFHRMNDTGAIKDKLAYNRSSTHYEEDIKDLMNQEGFWHIHITEMNYCLKDLLETSGLLSIRE